jgi:hypothetical protein
MSLVGTARQIENLFSSILGSFDFKGKGTYNPPLEARQSRQWHRAHVAGYEDLGKEMVMAPQLQLPWMVSSVAIRNIFYIFSLAW